MNAQIQLPPSVFPALLSLGSSVWIICSPPQVSEISLTMDSCCVCIDNSSPKENDEDRILFDETTNNNQLHSFVSEQVANTFCEVWCFGTNDLGQLGIGNNIPTRTPKRVKIPRGPVIKLAAGDNFTMALLASGEMFGWGANENNQLKLEASNYLPDPTPIKVDRF